jgi:transposase
MGMLEGQVQFVIGVDTHRDTHTAAVCDPTGAVLVHAMVATTSAGHRQLLGLAQQHASGPRVWAVEGTGSFGAGLTSLLVDHGEWVVEVDRPKRPARRNGAKSDVLDATRAAREVLAREHLAQPRARGDREALRVLLATRRHGRRPPGQLVPPAGPRSFLVHGTRPHQGELVRTAVPCSYPGRDSVGRRQ